VTDEERGAVIAAFEGYPLSPTARFLLEALIRTWEEALGDEPGLPGELMSLARDELFYRFLMSQRRDDRIRAVTLVHALQSVRLISLLVQRFPVLGRIHLDRD
jgi:hypothetical protein